MNDDRPFFMSDDGLPEQNPVQDGEDWGFCAGGRAAKSYHALAVYRTGKRIRVFMYHGMSTSWEGDNERIDLVFKELDTTWLVIIYGVRLESLLLALKECKIDWIKETAGNSSQFPPPHDNKPWIKKIRVHEIKVDAEGKEEKVEV